MVRLRMAKYCNLKCILLIFVIYGHWIETDIGSSKLLLIQLDLFCTYAPVCIFVRSVSGNREGL